MARSKAARVVEDVTGERFDGPPEGFKRRRYGPALSKEGDEITGKFVGEGVKRKIGRGKPARMFKIETDGGAVVEIVGSAQIAQFLDDCKKGQRVWIKRLSQVKGGKGRVNQYDFAVEE